MRKQSYIPLLILMFFLFSILSIPMIFSEKLKNNFLEKFCNIFQFKGDGKKLDNKDEIISQLTLQNQLLSSQIEGVYEWLSFEQRIEDQIQRLKSLSNEEHQDIYWREFFQRRCDELKKILEIELQSIPAKVIFRDIASWGNCIWINVGSEVNEILEREIVVKDSPVVVGESLVGIVEYVGKKHSKVRLITDPGLIPSVRALRGDTQNKQLSKNFYFLWDLLSLRDDLFSSPEAKEKTTTELKNILDKLSKQKNDFFLAKGEIRGGCRGSDIFSKNIFLNGTGFNYDFADSEGPSNNKAILQKGDLLVTTGMDGVFPAGLHVATVVEVLPLQEGSYYYDIKAKPTAENLDYLEVVFVMPPIKFEKEKNK